MRYAASEKLAIIRLVEGSSLPVRRTLERMGIPRATFYRWYDLYCSAGPEALEDHRPRPDRVWNRSRNDGRDLLPAQTYEHLGKRRGYLGQVGISRATAPAPIARLLRSKISRATSNASSTSASV